MHVGGGIVLVSGCGQAQFWGPAMQVVCCDRLVSFPASPHSPPVPPFSTRLAAASWNVTLFAPTEARTYVLPWRGLKSGGMGGKEDSDVLQIKIGFRGPCGEVRVGGVVVS